MINKLKYWCHKILPLAYDDSLSYYEVLAKLTQKINELIEWANQGIETYIKEAIGDIFVDTTYDEETETLDFSFNEQEGEGTSGDIANISVNGFTRPVKDTTARTTLATLAQTVNDLSGDVGDIAEALQGVVGEGQSNILIVAKRNARFSTVNAAIDYARTYCTTRNRVTIVIVGAGSEVYAESIDLDDNPGIDFYGINQPRIRSNVAWRYSTLRCSNTVTCEGIIFENYYEPQSGEHAGYGLHADPVTGEQIFINCQFYSDNNAGAGIGMGAYGSLTFRNCEFIGTNGLYIHNRIENNTLGQWARFYNCNFRSFSTNPAIRVYDAAYATDTSYVSQMGMVFANCTAYPNTHVQYVYDNAHSVPYIPSLNRSVSNLPSSNIFLVKNSVSPGIIGVDYDRNALNIFSRTEPYGSAYYIPLENAYKYNFSLYSARYSTDGGATFINVENPSSVVTLSAETNYPDQIRVEWYGWVAGRVNELQIKATAK